MGLKKKSKVSAEFNMSSLTDIIFLLLIFFMLTSSMVVPNALNLKLPGRTTTKTVIQSDPISVSVKRDGSYYVNGKRISPMNIEKLLKTRIRREGVKQVSMTISSHPNTAIEHVVKIMDMAYRYGISSALL